MQEKTCAKGMSGVQIFWACVTPFTQMMFEMETDTSHYKKA